MSYEQGQVVTLTFTVKLSGVLTTPTTATLSVQDPVGVVTTYTPAADSAGSFHQDLTPTLAGTYRYRWVSTGVGAGADEGLFLVKAPFSTSIPLSQAKQFLNMSLTRTTDDAELQGFLDAAVHAVEKRCGPLAPVSVTEVIYEHGWHLALRKWPVLAIQSVGVSAYLGQDPIDDTPGWVLDTTTGVARRRVVGGYMGYYGQGSVVTVTYTAGRTDLPPDLVLAVLYVLRAMWQSQRGASPLPSSADPMSQQYPGSAGFLLPDEAISLMLPYLVPSGIA